MIFFLWSCASDNFYETVRYFETDKESYQVGDEIKLKVFIVPKEDEKEIRFYNNFKNLRISFSLMNNLKGIHNGSWTKRSNEFLNDTTTTKFNITKEKPFEKTFVCRVSQTNTEIIIEIPELNFKVGFPKSDFDENTKVRIHGLCEPINPEIGASIEEFIEIKDIRIMTE